MDSATLDGSLEVLAAPTFDPPLNELIELIVLNEESSESEVITGEFDSISLAATTSGKAFELSVTELGVFLDPYLLGDFNGDDRRSGTDINLLLAVVGLAYDEQFDLNSDGTVEFGDFLALSANFGGWRSGDFDGDQRIDFSDFLLLSENYGRARAAVFTVPEPSSLALLLVSAFTLCIRVRSRLCHTQ